jgi:hypothetical protein
MLSGSLHFFFRRRLAYKNKQNGFDWSENEITVSRKRKKKEDVHSFLEVECWIRGYILPISAICRVSTRAL